MSASELTSVDELRAVYRPPGRGAVDKVIDRLDAHCLEFLAKSPMFVLSSADAAGRCDGSPKGGRAGFVEALDEHHVAWADSSGNNRLDSFQNIVVNPWVSLLFLIPGLDAALRINGTAELSTDRQLRERFSLGGSPARVVGLVTVDEVYIHCSKALHRAGLWSTDSWLDPADLPSAARIIRDHVGFDLEVEVLEAALERDSAETLWKPGGESDPPVEESDSAVDEG